MQYVKNDVDPVRLPFFRTPVFLATTVGIPFCTFKLLFGWMIIVSGWPDGISTAFGWAIIIWACADLLMNLARIVYDLSGLESPVEYCTIAHIGRWLGMTRLFLAVDTCLSFLIICLALWTGLIKSLSAFQSYLWYSATTLNLLSISLVSIWVEWQNRRNSS